MVGEKGPKAVDMQRAFAELAQPSVRDARVRLGRLMDKHYADCMGWLHGIATGGGTDLRML
jgi:hypothetical protein